MTDVTRREMLIGGSATEGTPSTDRNGEAVLAEIMSQGAEFIFSNQHAA